MPDLNDNQFLANPTRMPDLLPGEIGHVEKGLLDGRNRTAGWQK